MRVPSLVRRSAALAALAALPALGLAGCASDESATAGARLDLSPLGGVATRSRDWTGGEMPVTVLGDASTFMGAGDALSGVAYDAYLASRERAARDAAMARVSE